MSTYGATGPPKPERDSGGLEHHPDRHRKKDIDGDIVSAPEPFAKRLLDQWGTIWLFEISGGQGLRYIVEEGERRWEFKLLFSARSKFERQAAKRGCPVARTENS